MTPISSHNFSPFIPSEEALSQSTLPDKAVRVFTASAKLAGSLPRQTRNTIRQHMSVINSYYSNLIEGNRTRPHEIRAAQKGDYSRNPAKRDLQQESVAHINAQQWILAQSPDIDTLFSPEFLQAIHREFYRHVPDSLKELKNERGEIVDTVIPGEWRNKPVVVGKHIPPGGDDIPALIKNFCEIYHPSRYNGDKKLIATMCAHHRLAWIHPFADGNGRVARLFIDATLQATGIESYGVWCISRGLARSSGQYKQLLERADFPRQGNNDGRGLLSQTNLLQFCDYMLDTALDQIDYISGLLELGAIHKRIKNYVQARNDDRVPGIKGKVKDTAALVIYSAFVNGALERAQALELCAMPERSARRLISQLKAEGLLSATSSRSPLYWAIPEHAEPWYFPQLTPGV